MHIESIKLIKKYTKAIHAYCKRHPLTLSFAGLGILTALGAYVFYVRYPYAYSFSNFYAEDGKNFIKNLIEKGPVVGSLSLFNGYLIVGQYLVGVLGQVINSLFGHGFVTLAKSLAVASYLFLGFACSLPWLLFRRRLGIILSIILVVLLWTTPFGSYDYAVIGTIGNLKFAFLFIATLLVLYRNDTYLCNKNWQFIAIDSAILLCIMTNIVSLGLLPLLVWRYKTNIQNLIRKRSLKGVVTPGIISGLVLCITGVIYLLAVYIHGVPKLPGYLDGPLHRSALVALVYRASAYGLFFPVNYLFTSVYAGIVLIGTGFLVWLSRYRTTLLIIVYVMVINIAGFVYNRPGVTEYFVNFNDNGWPGLFFYAGTMLFMFGCAYAISDRFSQLGILNKLVLLATSIGVMIFVLPAAGMSHTDHYGQGMIRPTLSAEVQRVCGESRNNTNVTLGIYPSIEWTMELNRTVVCR